MISVAEAYRHILSHRTEFGTAEVPLLQSIGRILAAPVVADADFPAYHRVTMDGIAIDAALFPSGQREFLIENMQAAGQPPTTLQNKSNCIEVMTGAVLPIGTNAIVPYEDCTISDGTATVKSASVTSFQNVHLQGSDSKAGDELLPAGIKITPGAIGMLASVGLGKVTVKKIPAVAVCSTGDELVAIHRQPLPYQIRRSNVYTIAAALAQQGIAASLHHLPDEPEAMKRQLTGIIKSHDAVLLSGAVSKGKKDFLPEVLQQLGMQTIFHRVAQKPGKPLLFGVFDDGPVVFGFPGNPVSTLVCYQVYFRKWLDSCLNFSPAIQMAKLAADFTFAPNLSFHLPVELTMADGCLWANPCFGTNSGDAVSLSKAAGIITLPADGTNFKKGDVFELIVL